MEKPLSAADFRPTLYMKAPCPFCLKLAAFLSDAGIFQRFILKSFQPGDEHEQGIREELALHFKNPSFPTAEVESGLFINDSDGLVRYYANQENIDAGKMPFYQYVLSGPLRRMREQFGTVNELRALLAKRNIET